MPGNLVPSADNDIALFNALATAAGGTPAQSATIIITISARDPAPARPTYHVVATCYLIGDPRPFLTMIGAPWLGCSRWSEQARLLADYFECDRDDVAAPEGRWRGADGEDDTVDLITVAGRIVGSFERMISAEDVEAIMENTHG